MPMRNPFKGGIIGGMVFSLLFWSFVAGAATYYVDSGGGNDGNNGLSAVSAWRTVAKVNSFSFAAGDTVLLIRGGFWREQITVNRSGTSTAPLTFGAYGTGERPVICGSDPVTGWTVHDSVNHIWKAPFTWVSPSSPSFSKPDLVFFNGECGLKKTSLSALTGEKQWYWASNTLYVYSVSTPAGVEVGMRNYGVLGQDGRSLRYVTVQDIEIRNANYKSILIGAGNHNWIIRNVLAHHNGRRDDIEDGGSGNDRLGFGVRDCDNTLITGCTIYESGENAIQVTGGSNNVVEYCTIYNPHHHGIDMKGSTSRTCQNNVIRYNRVYTTPGFAVSINGIVLTDESAPNLIGTKIYGNLVHNIPDNGLLLVGSTIIGTEVYNNTIYNCHHCFTMLEVSSAATFKNNVGMTMTEGWHPVFYMEQTSTANKIVDYNLWIKKSTLDKCFAQKDSTTYSNLSTWRTATGWDAHSMVVDPLFVNCGACDFQLQSDSPCVDTGTPVGLATDIIGCLIPQGAGPDMGAYERASQAVNTPPVITRIGAAMVSVEVGSAYVDAGATAYDAQDGDLTSQIVKTGNVDTLHVGSYTITYNVIDSGGLSATPVTRTVNVVDTTRPVITRIGAAVATVEVGLGYTDAGATAQDNYDGNITSRIVVTSNVNSAVVGSYTVVYNVSDTSGNAALPVTRTVNVVDTTKPVIVLVGPPVVSVSCGSTYCDAGATATDNYDGNITARITVSCNVNTAVAGTYCVTYNVSDTAGNAADPVSRTVLVTGTGDTVKPVITMLGVSPVTVEVFSTYVDAGATAMDDVDGDITAGIVTINSVNTSVLGAYTVEYNVADAAGNAATPVARAVDVVDRTKPVITRLGSSLVLIRVGSTYIDAGATAKDNYDGDCTCKVLTTSNVNTAKAGSYTVKYDVKDTSGNAATSVFRNVWVLGWRTKGDFEDTLICLYPAKGSTLYLPRTSQALLALGVNAPGAVRQVEFAYDHLPVEAIDTPPYAVVLELDETARDYGEHAVSVSLDDGLSPARLFSEADFTLAPDPDGADTDGNGIPDNPLNVLKADRDAWIFVADDRAIGVLRFDGRFSEEPAVLAIANGGEYAQPVTIAVSPTVLEAGEIGILIVQASDTMESGLSPVLTPGGQYVAVSILVSNDGAESFAEIDPARLEDFPVHVSIQGIDPDVEDVTVYRRRSEIAGDPSSGLHWGDVYDGWTPVDASAVSYDANALDVDLTFPAVIAPGAKAADEIPAKPSGMVGCSGALVGSALAFPFGAGTAGDVAVLMGTAMVLLINARRRSVR